MSEAAILSSIGLAGGALGALFGALGSVANRVMGLMESRERRRDRQLEMAHEKDRWGHEAAARDQDRHAAAEAARAALNLSASEGSWRGLNASIEAEGRIGDSYPWVGAVRALTRPILTVMLWLLFLLLFLLSVSGALPEPTAEGVARSAVETVSFSAATALAWWFGDRAPRRDG